LNGHAATAASDWRPPRRGSLRTQLVFWNVLTLALLLAALGVVIRYAVQRTILASVDQELAQRTRPHPGGPPGAQDGGPPREGRGGFGLPPLDQPPGQGPPPGPDPYRPRRFDLQGRSMDAFSSATPWDPGAIAPAEHGQTVYSTVSVDGEPLRVISRPFPPLGAPEGVLQDAYPLADVDRAIAGLDRALLTLIPLALLCAGLGGALLTDRVLSRMRRMTQAAGRIGAQTLSERLPAAGNDEFSELAGTFNAMLGRLESAFEQQCRLVEQQRRFTADASHELKTPLTIIKGNTSMALSGPLSAADYRQSMQEIDRAADAMRHLVQDLLLLARSDSGQLARDPVELLLREVLEQAVAAVAPHAAAIRLTVSDDTLAVTGNEDELARVFTNLLDNAVHATPLGGTIAVTARCEDGIAVVTVADTGAGIAPQHLPHLGERFYRVDSARARAGGGTGLGLSICRSILDAHGGGMTFTSAIGKGTTVLITLPAVPAAALVAHAS
jgi:signal transduction histidine kinase